MLSKYPKAALIDLAVSLAGRCDDSERFSVLCEELEAVRAARGSK